MLDFSGTSILMAILSSNIVIMFLVVIFNDHDKIMKMGYSLIEIFCILTLLRLMFPFEILKISNNIYYPEVISRFIGIIIFRPYLYIGNMEISLWFVIKLIWLSVFFILYVRYIIAEFEFVRFVKENGYNITEDFNGLINKVCNHRRVRKKIYIYKFLAKTSPYVYKFSRNYYIVMPYNYNDLFTYQEIEYILSHEIMHIFHFDLEKKKFINIICMFYWWNPFCKKLKKQADLLFELRVDEKIAENAEKKKDYLKCIIKVLEQINFKDIPAFSIGFSEKYKNTLKDRFYILLENNGKRQKRKYRFLIIPIFLIYILSFLFVFEVSWVDEITKNTVIDSTNENTRIIEKEDGTYDIYFEGIFVENTDSLEYYKNLNVYSSEKEAFKDYDYEKK